MNPNPNPNEPITLEPGKVYQYKEGGEHYEVLAVEYPEANLVRLALDPIDRSRDWKSMPFTVLLSVPLTAKYWKPA